VARNFGDVFTPNLAFDFDDALLQLADPGLELLDELKVDVARYAG
jgi:hypothetical protein